MMMESHSDRCHSGCWVVVTMMRQRGRDMTMVVNTQYTCDQGPLEKVRGRRRAVLHSRRHKHRGHNGRTRSGTQWFIYNTCGTFMVLARGQNLKESQAQWRCRAGKADLSEDAFAKPNPPFQHFLCCAYLTQLE